MQVWRPVSCYMKWRGKIIDHKGHEGTQREDFKIEVKRGKGFLRETSCPSWLRPFQAIIVNSHHESVSNESEQ